MAMAKRIGSVACNMRSVIIRSLSSSSSLKRGSRYHGVEDEDEGVATAPRPYTLSWGEQYQIWRYHGVEDEDEGAFNGRPVISHGYIPPPMPSWAEKYEKAKARNSHVYTYHHWRIALKPLEGRPTPDEIIHYYVKTLSKLVGNRDEAIKKIYSAATKKGYAFCANIPPDQADIIEEFKNVLEVVPDRLIAPDKRDPSGEPLPLDTKHYPNLPLDCLSDEEWKRLRQPRRLLSDYAKPTS